MIEKALRRRILANPAITANLATYNFGNAPDTAVFRVPPLPEDVIFPAIVIEVSGATNSFETYGALSAEITGSVSIFGDKYRNDDLPSQIAWLIFKEIHRIRLDNSALQGWTGYAMATPPQNTVGMETFPGFIIQYRAVLNKKKEG